MTCECSYKVRGDDTVRCRRMGYPNDCCAHVKYCQRTRHWELSEYAANCPLRKQKDLRGDKNDGKQV